MNGETRTANAALSRSALLDYLELMKPELTGLSVLTALCGYYLSGDNVHFAGFFWTGLGTLLLGGGAGTLNQFLERQWDALMKRTERRPLPAGRIEAQRAFLFGVAASVSGLGILFLAFGALTGILGLLTFVLYVLVYTPMKRRSWTATLVGGIPGALPPVIGWTAAGGTLDAGALALFLILFFWQMPHFFSLAWMYRKDYGRAGYRMLTVLDESGSRTAFHILLHTAALVPVSIAMTALNITGTMYAVGALLLGIAFLVPCASFRQETARAGGQSAKINTAARMIFFASLIYLPSLFFLMTVDKM